MPGTRPSAWLSYRSRKKYCGPESWREVFPQAGWTTTWAASGSESRCGRKRLALWSASSAKTGSPSWKWTAISAWPKASRTWRGPSCSCELVKIIHGFLNHIHSNLLDFVFVVLEELVFRSLLLAELLQELQPVLHYPSSQVVCSQLDFRLDHLVNPQLLRVLVRILLVQFL